MHQAKADADVLIVETAVASAETVVVGNDTDLVCQNVNFRVFFKPKEEKCAELPLEATTDNILFLHVMWSCDITTTVWREKIAVTRMTTSSLF